MWCNTLCFVTLLGVAAYRVAHSVQSAVPGTGGISRMFDGPAGGGLYYLYLQTTTDETWRMVSSAGAWTKLNNLKMRPPRGGLNLFSSVPKKIPTQARYDCER